MSLSRYCGLLAPVLIFLLAAAPAEETGADPHDLERNRQLLEKWKTDGEHYARLRRDLRDFWALPESERRHLRQLDKELHDLDATTRKRLWKVAERYAAWLERLPEKERRRIETTTDPRERLVLIKEIHERQWVTRLPQKLREELDQLPADKRAARVVQLREQERQQRKLWQSSGPRRPAELPAGARQLVQKQLLPRLTEEEKRKYIASLGRPEFPRVLKELAKLHPVLPPLPPPSKPIVRFKDLPAKARAAAGSEAAWERRQGSWERLRKVEGKWPEWALLFHSLLTPQQQARMPPLGASQPKEFPREVAAFIKNKLQSKLNNDEKQQLQAAEGKWPEYPKRLLQLAEKHKLEVPGMSLPALPEPGSSGR